MTEPDGTAVRVALWRALHVEVDAEPHVLDDTIGLRLVAPADDWRARRDMNPRFTDRSRASIVARARFVEDLVRDRAAAGVEQYVLLGAGLDTFAQRHADLAARVRVFEVDQPGTQAWKRDRLDALAYADAARPRFVPVDFEAGASWWDELVEAGFDPSRPAVVASTGVLMYLTLDAVSATLRQATSLAPGSTLVVSFMRPLALVDPEERPSLEGAAAGARAAGTPFRSLFAPDELLALAAEAGLHDVRHVSAAGLDARYFSGRIDGLCPSSAEELIVATL